MSSYKLYTHRANGNKILLCKSEDYMAARYLMAAICAQYPAWYFELCRIRGDKSEKISRRYAESQQIKECEYGKRLPIAGSPAPS